MGLREEANEVELMVAQPGYAVLVRYIKEEYDKEIKKLRKYARKPDDEPVLKVSGGLDKLEWVLKLPEKIINRREIL